MGEYPKVSKNSKYFWIFSQLWWGNIQKYPYFLSSRAGTQAKSRLTLKRNQGWDSRLTLKRNQGWDSSEIKRWLLILNSNRIGIGIASELILKSSPNSNFENCGFPNLILNLFYSDDDSLHDGHRRSSKIISRGRGSSRSAEFSYHFLPFNMSQEMATTPPYR